MAIPVTATRSDDSGPGVLRVFAGGRPDAALAVAVFATHLSVNGGDATVIGREWGVTTHRTCGNLCEGHPCSFSNGFCQVPVYRHVPLEECRTFRLSTGDA